MNVSRIRVEDSHKSDPPSKYLANLHHFSIITIASEFINFTQFFAA